MSVSVESVNLAAPALRAAAAPDSTVTATGELSPEGGGVVFLSGSYDTATDSLRLTGQGYTFLGYHWKTTVPPTTEGEYTGPNGSGLFGCFPGSTSIVKVFCGRFQSASSQTAGRWNIEIVGGVLGGLMAPDGASSTVGFSGTVTGTGTIRALAFSTSGTGYVLHGNGSWNTGTNQVTGSWSTTGDAGTWTGDLCLAGTTGPN